MLYSLAILLVTSLVGNVVLFRLMKRHNKVKLSGSDETDLIKSQLNDYRSKCLKLSEQLRESELLARLVLQSPNAIMLMDHDGNIQMINKGFSQMYEYSYQEFVNTLGSNYRQTSFSSDVEFRLNRVKETKQPYRYEALNVTKTGRELWTQTALMPILDDEGNVTHLATIDTDINQRIVKSDSLISEMEQLNTKIDHLAKQFKYLENEFTNLFRSITELFQLVEHTSEILTFVKGISDETRILGFNASIEASRAGEQGVGFRVITNEIIEISDRTIQSISQIKNIIESIKEKQGELSIRRDDSETRMMAYHQVVTILKKEVRDIEMAITEFKSLA